MMNKAILISLFLLLIVSCEQPKKAGEIIDKPFTMNVVKDIVRAEIDKPDGTRLVLKKNKGVWNITEPIEARLSEFHTKKLESILADDIKTDGFVLSSAKLADYDLSEKSAYKVSLFTKDKKDAGLVFFVGKESGVSSKGKKPTKNGRRSYIKTTDGKPYRAISEISTVVRAPLSNLRSKVIFESPKEPEEISILPRKGESVKFLKADGKWVMSEPQKEKFSMDPLQVKELVKAFVRLKSNGFADKKSDKEMDLDPPRAVVSARFGKEIVKYEVGNPAKKIYYVRRVGSKYAHKLTKGPGRVLAGDYMIFKNRVEKTIPLGEITSFQLNGKKINIVKKNGKWFSGKIELDATKIDPLLGTFAVMRAVKWKHENLEEAGLSAPEGSVILRTKDKTHKFEVGKVFKKDGGRYGRWSDSEYVMEIPYFIWDRMNSGLEKLKAKEKK